MSHNGLSLVRRDGTASGGEQVACGPRVLLVEDDADIRESLSEALQEEGFVVATATNGREALETLRSGLRPDAILLDLMMPVMDGWDFRHAQLNDPALRDIPVVVVTATGSSPETIRAQLGDVELVAKPVHYLRLLEAVSRSCGAASSAA